MATSTKEQSRETVKRLYQIPVTLERRNGAPRIYARTRTFVNGKRHVKSTGEDTEAAAEKWAMKWYVGLLVDAERTAPVTPTAAAPAKPSSPLFEDAVDGFLRWADREKEASRLQRRNYHHKWSLLEPFFKGVTLTDVDINFLERVRGTRKASTEIVDALGRKRTRRKPVTNNTLKKDMNFIRLVLKWAHWEKMLAALPQFPAFKGKHWKVKSKKSRRPALSPAQWRRLKKTALAYASEPNLNPRTRLQRQELYAFVMMLVGGAMRPEEGMSLRWKDCTLGRLPKKDIPCVYLWVHGKWTETDDVEYDRDEAWALYDGVIGFKYLQKVKPHAEPTDKLFDEYHPDLFSKVLDLCDPPLAPDIRSDSNWALRSLRSTGITLRLTEGDDMTHDDVAVWARTSPAQIKDWYDQVNPHARVERVAGFRGDMENESDRTKKSRQTLNRLRKQARMGELADNDDVYGTHPDDDAEPEPNPAAWEQELPKASGDDARWEEHLSTKSRAKLKLVKKRKKR